MKRKQKKCKGTGRAKGHGCGDSCFAHKYGLCLNCFKVWLFNTPEGKEVLESTKIRAKQRAKSDIEIARKKEAKAKKESIRKKSWYEGKLQDEVNAIVRLIDTEKGCISCDHGWNGKVTRQFHAGHRKSVGGHPSIRYHFSNIFKQCSICNNWKSGNERAFDSGIKRIYGAKNLQIVQSLESKYPSIHLSITELKEKIIIARQLKKEILSGKHFSRKELNDRLGIYK